MKISIIIPVYNSERTICDCIESILDSTNFNEVEIILVDDHSSDDSWQICEKISKENHNVFLIQNTYKGVSSARNMGIKCSTGDIVGFCDADDHFEKGTIHKVVSLFEQHPDIDILVGSVCVLSGDSKDWLRRTRNKDFYLNESDEYVIRCLTDKAFMGSVCNKFYKKELLKNGIRFDPLLSYCEDTYFNIKIAKNNKNIRVLVCSFFCYIYYKNGISATSNNRNLFDEMGRLKYINSLMQIEEDFELNDRERAALNSAKYYVATDNYRYAFGNSKERLRKIILDNEKYYFRHVKRYGIIRFLRHYYMGRSIKKSVYDNAERYME